MNDDMREERCILRIQTGFVCKKTKYCCRSCTTYFYPQGET